MLRYEKGGRGERKETNVLISKLLGQGQSRSGKEKQDHLSAGKREEEDLKELAEVFCVSMNRVGRVGFWKKMRKVSAIVEEGRLPTSQEKCKEVLFPFCKDWEFENGTRETNKEGIGLLAHIAENV